jgi:hypothetical protein
MIIFSFVASLFLILLKVLEGIFKAFRKSSLEVALTREVFFRIFESGESLYANAVLISHDVGALVRDIKVHLKKENGAIKDFELKIAQIGEKYRTSDGLYQFSFHSSSPLTFVPENSPQRQVYICEYESYSEATKVEFQKFQQKLFQIREKYGNIPDLSEPTPQNAQILIELKEDVSSAINTACIYPCINKAT